MHHPARHPSEVAEPQDGVRPHVGVLVLGGGRAEVDAAGSGVALDEGEPIGGREPRARGARDAGGD